MITAFPLNWPLGYERTERNKRVQSRFDQQMDDVQEAIRKQVKLLGATALIISSNANVRTNGYMYAEMMNERVSDPGVAIYFTYDKQQVSMCCDYYERVWENLYALAVSIEALRTISRHHVSEFLKRSFTGFGALPPPAEIKDKESIWQILGFPSRPDDKAIVWAAYKIKVKKIHPDVQGGSKEAFQQLQEAYEQALKTYDL